MPDPTPHNPTPATRAKVKAFVASGISQAGIASSLGIARSTLNLHYKAELATGAEEMIGAIGSSVMQRALAGDNTCAIFVLKTRGGWTEKVHHEHSGAVEIRERLKRARKRNGSG